MAIVIKKTSDVKLEGIKAVIYGFSGVGKTKLGSTANDVLYISAEDGLLSVADDDLPYIEIKNEKDIDDAFKFCKKNPQYKTIYVDSLSEIAENLLATLKKDVKDPRQAYGATGDAMTAMIRNFRGLKGRNVVFTAKQMRKEDDSGVVRMEPLLPGQVLPAQLPYLFDLVACYQLDRKGVRFIQTEADRNKDCKDRSGKLNKNEKPDLERIFAKMRGDQNASSTDSETVFAKAKK